MTVSIRTAGAGSSITTSPADTRGSPRHRPDSRGRTRRTTRPTSSPEQSCEIAQTHAFYWRYDAARAGLLNRLWPLVSLRCNSTPTKSRHTPAPNQLGRHKLASMTNHGHHGSACRHRASLDAQQLSTVAARIEEANHGRSTRRIGAIQMQLLDLAKTKTEALATASTSTCNHCNRQSTDWPRRIPLMREHQPRFAHFYVWHLGCFVTRNPVGPPQFKVDEQSLRVR